MWKRMREQGCGRVGCGVSSPTQRVRMEGLLGRVVSVLGETRKGKKEYEIC